MHTVIKLHSMSAKKHRMWLCSFHVSVLEKATESDDQDDPVDQEVEDGSIICPSPVRRQSWRVKMERHVSKSLQRRQSSSQEEVDTGNDDKPEGTDGNRSPPHFMALQKTIKDSALPQWKLGQKAIQKRDQQPRKKRTAVQKWTEKKPPQKRGEQAKKAKKKSVFEKGISSLRWQNGVQVKNLKPD